MTQPKNIHIDGVEVLAPCAYTADNAAEAINNLTQATYEASGNAWDAYGSGKSLMANPTPDSFMDDVAEAFSD